MSSRGGVKGEGMSKVAYLLIAFGILLLVLGVRDEQRGIASVMPPDRNAQRITVTRTGKPEEFHNLMSYQWIRGFVVVAAGMGLLAVCRRIERADTFSPDFAGNAELDEWSRGLDEMERKNHHLEK